MCSIPDTRYCLGPVIWDLNDAALCLSIGRDNNEQLNVNPSQCL